MNRKISKTNIITLFLKTLVFAFLFLILTSVKVNAYSSIDTERSLVMPICANYYLGTGTHPGYYAIDFINSEGPPVFSSGPGVVVLVAYMEGVPGSGYGHYVMIEHTLSNGTKIQTLYAHLASVSVVQGSQVDVNTQVGIMGMSGGGGNGIVHLHYEIRNSAGVTIPPDFITANVRSGDCSPAIPIPTGSPVPPGPTITPLPNANEETVFEGDSDKKSYYLDTPYNWDMDSCEKVIVEGPQENIIIDAIKVWKCVGGKSAGNNTLDCNKKWVVAWAETVSVDNFPLLNLLSSSQPTEENLVRPACYYNVTKNITKEVLATDRNGNVIADEYVEQGMTFTKNYMGLINISSKLGKDVDIAYPKLGTAISCTTLNWDDYNYGPKFDIQLYNTKLTDMELLMPDGSVAGASQVKGLFSDLFGDDWWTRMIDNLKNLFKYVTSLDDSEAANIKEVKNFLPGGRTSVCECSTSNKITRVNESDIVEPLPGAKRVVVNENKEILNFTNTELCDLQYNDDQVFGITGCHMTGSIHDSGEEWVKGARDASLKSQYPNSYFEFVISGYNPITGAPIMKCDHGTFCGKEFSCSASISSMYAACRGTGLSVQEYDGAVTGDPKYRINEKGFDKLTIPGLNKTLYNAQVAIEQINSPFDIKYGENIGVRIPTTWIMYDLNTKDIAYVPNKSVGPDMNPSAIKSSLKYFISYKKTDYNYRFLNDWNAFDRIGSNLGPNKAIKYDFYFPYIGKLPYLYERISAIHSNEYKTETAATLLNEPIKDELIYDPQIDYCDNLSEDEKLKQDCYTKEVCGDLMTDYLEKRNLSFFNCVKYPEYTDPDSNPPGGPNPPIPSGPPGPTEPPGPTDGPIITVTPGPIPVGPFECDVIDSEQEALAFIATVVAKYPDKLTSVGFKFEGSNGYCDAYGTAIRCDASFRGKSFMTNKLVFHELMHFSRDGVLGGGHTNATSELQASLMESIVVSGSCYGGAYNFQAKDNTSRVARAVTSDLLNKGGMSEEQLWQFALGRSDTITSNVSKVVSGGSEFYDLYCKNYGYGDPVKWYGSPLRCSSGSGDAGIKPVTSSLLNVGKIAGVSVDPRYCPSSGGSGTPTPTPGPGAESMNCLIYNTAKEANKNGYRVSPEAIYAILMAETNMACGISSREACNGDANQISANLPGGGFATLPYTVVKAYPGDDGIGISQAVSWRIYEDIPKFVSEMDMIQCMGGIGVNVGDTNPQIKDPASSSIITRLRVGDSLCYIALLMKDFNSDFSEADRYNILKFGEFGFYYNKSQNYLRYLPYFAAAAAGNIFAGCE